MQHFKYKGKNKNNDIIEGYIDSKNKDDAVTLLKNENIEVVEIEVSREVTNPIVELLLKFNIRIGYPTLSDLIILARQMYSLTRAGVPIIRAIKVVTDSVTNKELELALEDIRSSLEGGQALAVSLKKHKYVFPTIFHALVNVGENTGALDQVFSQLAVHFGRESETIKRVKSATRYPMIVMITIVVAIGIINIFVIPAFASFFGQFGVELPLPTRILIASSNFTVNYWYLIIVGALGVFISWMSYINTETGRLHWDKWKIGVPIIGTIIEKSLLARFARSFALCSRTGVPLLESISIIADTTDNKYVSTKIYSIKEKVERGESITASAKESGLFTPLVIQMMSIGEETGELDKLLDEVADFYEQEVDYSLKKLSDSIEPILIGIVAVLVLILALGVFLPMWDISKVALKK